MLERFRRFFLPPIFEDDEKTRTAQILNSFGWLTAFVVMGIFVPRFFMGEWLSVSSRVFFPAVLIILLGMQFLLRQGYVQGAGAFMVIMIWLALTLQANFSDGLRDVSVLAYSILVLLATLLLGWKNGLTAGVLSFLALWFFAYQEYIGVRTYSIDPPLSYARDLSAVFLITSLLAYLLIQRVNQSLSEARLELRERLKADEKLQQQASYLSALHETTFDLLNRLEINPLLERILDRVSELLETPHVGIDLLISNDRALVQALGRGKFSEWNGEFTQRGHGLVGTVWQQGILMNVEDYNTYTHRVSDSSEIGFYAIMGAPLKSGQKVVGVLVAAHTHPARKFTPEQKILFERLAALVSLALDNARLYEDAQNELLERKLIEQDLRSSEERFRKVFNNNNIAVSIVTLEDGIFLDGNQAFWQLTGIDPVEAIGRSTLEFNVWQTPEERKHFVQELTEKGALENIEVNYPGSGRISIGYYELITIKDQLCVLSMFYDMTEQKRAQEALLNAESRMRAIISSIPDLIFEVSRTGIFLDFLASAELVPIMEPAQFIGRHIHDLFPQHISQQAIFAIERALLSGRLQAFEYGLPPGEEIQFFEARVSPITPESVIIMIRDISQRKWVETERETLINELESKNAESEALRESLAIIVETLDESKAVSLILEQLEKVIPCDSASVQLLKNGSLEIVSTLRLFPPEEHLGLQYSVHEKEPAYQLIQGHLPFVLLEDVKAMEYTSYVPPYGQIRSWMAVPLRIKGQIVGIITLDGHIPGQFTRKHADLAVTYANQVAIAIENARLFSAVQQELSTRKKLIEELEVKNAELERFTYTVSHDLKSPLITIKGFLGFLTKDAVSGNLLRLNSDIRRISDATDKMQALLNELLELSRIGRQANPSQYIPFSEIISETLELLQGRLHSQRVQVQVEDNLPVVYGDRQRLLEVVQNLVDNAAKFTGTSENPKIEIGLSNQASHFPTFFVRDNGMGIDPIHHERIFGLFNKLDAASEGTGIGLALVKRIIEVHGGTIWVTSQPGEGATFFFTLPTQPVSES